MENIQINTHSSIKIREGEKTFYFDPFKLEGRYSDADYIFITHDHFDHLDPKSISNVRKNETVYICPKSIAKTLAADCGIKDTAKIIQVSPDDEIKLEDNISFYVTPAYNTNKNFHQKNFNWVGYVLKVNDKTFFVAGDTDVTDEIKKVKCDVALVPIGGTYTMDANEAASFINLIKPKLAIPTHYGSVIGEANLGKLFISQVDKSIETKELIDFVNFKKVNI